MAPEIISDTRTPIMKLFGRDLSLRSLSSSLIETRSQDDEVSDLKNPSPWLFNAFLAGAESSTGIRVTPLRALGVAKVFACVNVRTDAIATLPLEVLQRQGRGSRKATEHRLFTPLSLRPNRDMTSVIARRAMMSNYVLRSHAFGEVLRDSDGDAVGLYPIENARVHVQRDTHIRPGHANRELTFTLDTGAKLPVDDVLYLMGTTFDGLLCTDVSIAARECLALAIALQDNAAKFFGNGSRPGGVLEHPGALSPEAQERLRDQIETQVSGSFAYRMMVLEEGLKYSAIRSDNTDSQFVEARDQQNLDICSLFKVPPHKVGIKDAQPRANVEQDNISFITDTVRPDAVTFEQEMDCKMLTEEERDQGYYIQFNLDALQRGDRASRYTAMGIGRQWGFLSANDCREEDGRTPIKGGDTYLQPVNMVDATKADQVLLAKPNQSPSNEPTS